LPIVYLQVAHYFKGYLRAVKNVNTQAEKRHWTPDPGKAAGQVMKLYLGDG
jgi:hypothetical protein